MDAKEVNLCHFELLVTHSNLRWHTADRSDQLLRLGGTDTDVPFLSPAWRHQSPVSVSQVANKTLADDPYQCKNDCEYLNRNIALSSST